MIRMHGSCDYQILVLMHPVTRLYSPTHIFADEEVNADMKNSSSWREKITGGLFKMNSPVIKYKIEQFRGSVDCIRWKSELISMIGVRNKKIFTAYPPLFNWYNNLLGTTNFSGYDLCIFDISSMKTCSVDMEGIEPVGSLGLLDSRIFQKIRFEKYTET